MADPRDVARPYAPPDGSDPAARDTMRVTAPVQVGDRVAWVQKGARFRGRDVEHLGTVAPIDEVEPTGNIDPRPWPATLVRVDLDQPHRFPFVLAHRDEVYPRPSR